MDSAAPEAEGTTAPSPQGTSPQYASQDQLRAMAHPLRLDIMERMGRRGTARAADLAADLRMPANSVSYHLRILARGGVIEEAPEAARDRRDRVWRLAQDSYEHGRRGPAAMNDPASEDATYLDASGATALAAFDWMRAAWRAEVTRTLTAHAQPKEGLGQLFATSMRLSQDQMRELNAHISAKIQEYQQINRDEHGADLAGDPDSEGEALTFRTMWVTVGDPSPSRDGDHRDSGAAAPGTGAEAQRPEYSPSSSSTASPSSRA